MKDSTIEAILTLSSTVGLASLILYGLTVDRLVRILHDDYSEQWTRLIALLECFTSLRVLIGGKVSAPSLRGLLRNPRMSRCCQFSEDRKEPSAGRSRSATDKLGDMARAENWRNPEGVSSLGHLSASLLSHSPFRDAPSSLHRYLPQRSHA